MPKTYLSINFVKFFCGNLKTHIISVHERLKDKYHCEICNYICSEKSRSYFASTFVCFYKPNCAVHKIRSPFNIYGICDNFFGTKHNWYITV